MVLTLIVLVGLVIATLVMRVMLIPVVLKPIHILTHILARVDTNHRHVLLLKCKRLQHLRNVLAVQLRELAMLAVLKIVRSKV